MVQRLEGKLKKKLVWTSVKDLLYFKEVIYTKEYWKPKHFIFFDFYCTANDNAEVKIDGQEIIDYIWVKPEKALKLRTDSFTKDHKRLFGPSEK